MEYLLKVWPPTVLKSSRINQAGIRSLETSPEEDNWIQALSCHFL